MKLLNKKYIRLPLIIALIAGIVLAGASEFLFTKHSQSVSSTIELLYDGAADGLAPNGELFSIDNIKKDSIVQAAIDSSEISVSIEEVKDNIVIQGIYPEDLAEKIAKFDSLLDFSTSRELNLTNYNPTKFHVTLNNNFTKRLSKASLQKLFAALMEQYQAFFTDNYSAKIDWTVIENTCNNGNLDYFQDIETMEYEISLMENYSKQLAAVDSSFEYNGSGFNDFCSSCESFGENTLSDMLANVYLNGLSRDTQRLIRKYTFQLQELYNNRAQLQENVDNVDALINAYSKDSSIYMSSDSGVATVKSNSNKTYEALVDEKKNLTQEIIDVNSDISKIEIDIAQIRSANEGTTDKTAHTKLESDIESAKKKMDALKTQFSELCGAFNKKYASEDVLGISAATYYGAKSIPVSFVKKCIKYCIVTVGLAVVYILCYELLDEIRKRKVY